MSYDDTQKWIHMALFFISNNDTIFCAKVLLSFKTCSFKRFITSQKKEKIESKHCSLVSNGMDRNYILMTVFSRHKGNFHFDPENNTVVARLRKECLLFSKWLIVH